MINGFVMGVDVSLSFAIRTTKLTLKRGVGC